MEEKLKAKEKLKTKDLIYAGAFAAIYLVLMLVIVMFSGLIPVLYIISPLTVGIVCGTVYLVYVSKVRKFGAVLILSILFGIITGVNSVYAVAWSVLTGLFAELVVRAGAYQSKKMFVLSYWVFNLNMIGPFFMLVYAKDTFLKLCAEYYPPEHVAQLDKLTPNWIIFALAGLALLGGIIGSLIGSKLIKKHFEKAGVI